MSLILTDGVRVEPLAPLQGADERGTSFLPTSGQLAVFRDADGREIGRSSHWKLDRAYGLVMLVKGGVPAQAARGDFLFAAGIPFGWGNVAILKGA